MTPECNKNDALMCISIAKAAIAAGQLRKAKKLLLKAQKLYPTPYAERLLENLSDEIPSTSRAESPRASASSTRKRLNSGRRSTQGAQVTYGPKQEKAIRDVLDCNDHYELFGVPRDASTAEIEKSYKQLALLLHPDKNRAPGASEAFKKVKDAKDLLTDPQRRHAYDTRDVPNYTSNLNMNLVPSDELVTAVTVIGGAFLGGFLAFKLIEHFQKLWNGEKSTVATSDSNNNRSRPT